VAKVKQVETAVGDNHFPAVIGDARPPFGQSFKGNDLPAKIHGYSVGKVLGLARGNAKT